MTQVQQVREGDGTLAIRIAGAVDALQDDAVTLLSRLVREPSLLGEEARVEPVIGASRGSIEISSARPLHAISGWRAMFDLKLTDDSLEPINLRLFLALDGQPLTEIWIYQYTPPPLDQRKIL